MKKIKSFFTKKNLKEFLYINIGLMIATFSFSFFLEPNNLVIGGTSGIGIIVSNFTSLNTPLIILGINVILLIIALFTIGKDFFIKTIYGSIAYPGYIWLFDLLYRFIFPNDSPITNGSIDMTMIIIFSSLLMGYGLGLSMKHGASSGGTEIPQYIFLKYFHMPFSVSIIIIDGTIVILGGILMKDYSLILYAIVFVYLSGLVMDSVIFNGFNKRAVHIISCKNEEIKQTIMKDLNRGVTDITVTGGYTKDKKSEIVCVLSNNQFFYLKSVINKIDPKAFYYVVRASEVGGEGFTYE